LDPFQVLQKPSLLSFHVPSFFAPAFPIGSLVILPSAEKTILYFVLPVEAVKGWPLKKVA
jgi:hypothetical protein